MLSSLKLATPVCHARGGVMKHTKRWRPERSVRRHQGSYRPSAEWLENRLLAGDLFLGGLSTRVLEKPDVLLPASHRIAVIADDQKRTADQPGELLPNGNDHERMDWPSPPPSPGGYPGVFLTQVVAEREQTELAQRAVPGGPAREGLSYSQAVHPD